MEYKRLPKENIVDWQVRIYYNKKAYGLSWEDIKDLFNQETGESYGESKWRKWLTTFVKGMDYQKNKNISDDEVLNELEMKKIEADKAAKKVQSLTSEFNKLKREEARRELLIDSIKESITTLPSPTFQPLASGKSSTKHKEYVLSFGDTHFGKKFKSLHNEYSEEITYERMQDLIKDVVEIINKEKITHLQLINGADSVEGMTLRISQLKSLQSGFVDQVIKYCKMYSAWLNELSKYVKLTVHHLTSSNHTELRPFSSNRSEFPAEDMERIIAMYIQDTLVKNERIKVKVYEDGIADFTLCGYNVLALHGHQIKNNKSVLKDLSFLRKKFYDYCFVSHFHHGNALTVGEGITNNMEVIQVPSIMGSDEYSDSLMTGAKAGASLHVFEEGKGRTISYSIVLN